MRFVTLLAIFLLLLSTTSFAKTLSSSELISRAEEFDGETVDFEGEIIGDMMQRGESVLVNLYDGENAIGVWIPLKDMPEISYIGRYNTKGDWLRITGKFNRSCKIHSSDLDIHATKVKKTREGRRISEPLNICLLYTSPSPRDLSTSRMPSSA